MLNECSELFTKGNFDDFVLLVAETCAEQLERVLAQLRFNRVGGCGENICLMNVCMYGGCAWWMCVCVGCVDVCVRGICGCECVCVGYVDVCICSRA